MQVSILHCLQKLFSWFGLIAGLLAVGVVFGSYVVSAQQAYRGPSLFYFYIFLFLALWSRKWSTFFLIFILPLLPSLATQAEFIIHPRVKYFIAYPGVDAIVGLFVGQLIRALYKKEKICEAFALPPWPIGLTIFVIAVSAGVTIARSLWQSATTFFLPGFLSNLFRFKHISLGNDYLVLGDLIVYSTSALLIVCILPTINQANQKDDFVFKPVIFGLLLAAVWGLVQSMTGFGLPPFTLEYRTDSIGYGAFGFQPDIHAFAQHMMLGAIGLLGYMFTNQRVRSANWGRLIFCTCLLSWVALVLSKSRANFIFAMLFTVGVLINALFRQKNKKTQRLIIITFVLGTGLIGLLYVSGNLWFDVIIDEILALQQINFKTLNRLSVYRLELFAIALKMLADFPFMGVGQGNFLSLSSVPSHISAAGYENAHNYFLQTAAELGFAGLIGFTLVFIVPYLNCKDKRALAPACVAVIAIFLGNIYSHPLLIRENLFLLTVFVALLYAQATETSPFSTLTNQQRLPTSVNWVVLFGIVCFCYFALNEVSKSFSRSPFLKGSQCFKVTDKLFDGWMGGTLTIDLPANAQRLRIIVDKNQPDAVADPLSAELTVIDSNQQVLIKNTYLGLNENDFSFEVVLDKLLTYQGALQANLIVSRCFTESNFALSDDSKKRGLHIKQIIIE